MSRRSDRDQLNVKHASTSLDKFDDEAIDYIDRVDRYSLKGSRTNTPGPRSKGTHSDPTPAEALQGHPSPCGDADTCNHPDCVDSWDDYVEDITRQKVGELRNHLERAAAHARAAERILAALRNRPDLVKMKDATGDICLACKHWVSGMEEDRLRSGFCPACYQAWARDGRPDHGEFILRRQQQVA